MFPSCSSRQSTCLVSDHQQQPLSQHYFLHLIPLYKPHTAAPIDFLDKQAPAQWGCPEKIREATQAILTRVVERGTIISKQ